ncbi:hypothetical protein GOV03_05165 [Candidatus Woesearchaeota archaeon]|nr:hypothetical protein [Candidatus Woesearchaeota archaeon]
MLKKRFRVDRCSCNSVKFRSKKGQITVFIILGILLLLALALVILFRKEIFVFKPGELIPTEKGKVETFVSSCITEIGDDALFLAGLQGGYIEMPAEMLRDGSQHLKMSPFNVVPYWVRGETLNIPSLDYIKNEIDDRIELELRNCLLGKEAFEEAYDIIEKSDISADTEIVDTKVIFNVRWDLEVRNKAGDVITSLVDHLAESPIKLKRVYETARQIVEREITDLKLEYLTQDLIALEHPNVPAAGMELGCSKKTWKADEVKAALKDMLRINVRELKIEGTEFVEFPEELPYYQNHYVWDIGEMPNDVSVAFNFDNTYPFSFYVTPQSNGMMKSGMQGGSDILSFLCLQIWKFTYDVSYPVLVRVRDETTGYNFQMAFTVHLVKNMPNRELAESRSPSFFVDTITDEDYCQNSNTVMNAFAYELIENEQTGVYWREPLEDVAISFTCLKYRCEIGETKYNFGGSGHVAGLTTNFPYCVGGILRGEKEGYKEDWERVVTKPGEKIDLDLVPVFKFPAEGLKVVKHELITGAEGLLVGGEEELEADETIMIKLINKKDGEVFHNIEWASSPELRNEENREIMEGSEVEFLGKTDFEYEVEVYLFNEEEMKGGYKGTWTVDWEALSQGKEIVFHVLEGDFSDDNELFDFMVNLDEHSKIVPLPKIN